MPVPVVGGAEVGRFGGYYGWYTPVAGVCVSRLGAASLAPGRGSR